MPIKDYSTDPDLNVQISGINIAEGCPPSGINNAIRQLMADVKEESEAKAEAITAAGEALTAFAENQATRDAEQDAAIAEAKSSAEAAQRTANSKQDNLGFTPIQQGGGVGQAGNKVCIGWTGTGLKCTVDSTDLGTFAFSVNGAVADAAGNVPITKDPSGMAFCTFTNMYNNAIKFYAIGAGATDYMPSGGTWNFLFWYAIENGGNNNLYGESTVVAGGGRWTNGSTKTVFGIAIRLS